VTRLIEDTNGAKKKRGPVKVSHTVVVHKNHVPDGAHLLEPLVGAENGFEHDHGDFRWKICHEELATLLLEVGGGLVKHLGTYHNINPSID
jgi:hypothetical protein